jgi:hypothetical protein
MGALFCPDIEKLHVRILAGNQNQQKGLLNSYIKFAFQSLMVEGYRSRSLKKLNVTTSKHSWAHYESFFYPDGPKGLSQGEGGLGTIYSCKAEVGPSKLQTAEKRSFIRFKIAKTRVKNSHP